MSSPTATPTPSVPSPANPVIAEQHRIERIVAGLRNGESTVINGTPVTAVSLQVADLLGRHEWASARCRRLSAAADYDGCLRLQDEMAMCRCQLAAVGMLHLVEAVAA
jgi:hypothetical protein